VGDYNDRRVRYYDRAAPAYDNAFLGMGPYADRERSAGLAEDLRTLAGTISRLPPGRILDVACGTGFLTRHLKGEVTGLDASEKMLDVARKRVPEATFVRGGAFDLPFTDASFDLMFTSNFYGLFFPPERARFLAEADGPAGRGEARRLAGAYPLRRFPVQDLPEVLHGPSPGRGTR
jgi:ubiquinone/menaquinone biosynthesis C-methylase UbiE